MQEVAITVYLITTQILQGHLAEAMRELVLHVEALEHVRHALEMAIGEIMIIKYISVFHVTVVVVVYVLAKEKLSRRST